MMGGTESLDFLAPASAGENTLITCENGDFAADMEVAETLPSVPIFPETLVAPEEVETPDVKTCEALGQFLGIDVAATSKAMPVTGDDGVVLALIRGDDRIEPAKLDAAIGGPSRPSTDDEIRAAFGASGGSLGPVGFKGRIIADLALRHGQYVAARTATAGTCAESKQDATSSRSLPTSAPPRRPTPVLAAEARCSSQRRSRSATSSSSARSTRTPSGRGSPTRMARSAT